jgi:hypothetical protein
MYEQRCKNHFQADFLAAHQAYGKRVSSTFILGMLLGMYKTKTPRQGRFQWVTGGNGGIRTLDEALHPILP